MEKWSEKIKQVCTGHCTAFNVSRHSSALLALSGLDEKCFLFQH